VTGDNRAVDWTLEVVGLSDLLALSIQCVERNVLASFTACVEWPPVTSQWRAVVLMGRHGIHTDRRIASAMAIAAAAAKAICEESAA